MSQIAERSSIRPSNPAPIPRLEHGDHLTVEEFQRRYNATPGLKKAELIDGRVYLAHEHSRTTIPPNVHPLENGDHLTVEEFERRYEAMPGLKKAELIDGRVYVAPPVSHSEHSVPHADLLTLVSMYRAFTPGTTSGDNGSVRFEKKNLPQPDVYLFILPSHGGQAAIGDDGYVIGAPELIAEIAASSASFDLHDKLDLYARSGVREYIVWRTHDGAIDYLVLREGKYVPLATVEGVFRSEVFPGLWIDSGALFAGDLARAMGTVQKGIGSAEHIEFVALLGQRVGKGKS